MKTLTVLMLVVVAFGCGNADLKGDANNANNQNNANNTNNGNNLNNNRPAFTACTSNSDCVVRSLECCDTCSEWTTENSIALAVDLQVDYRDSVCVGNEGCPRCASQPNPELVASCRGGTCQLVDLSENLITQCTAPEQCIVRSRDCCACGSSQDSFISIATSQVEGLLDLVCDDPPQACAGCEPDYTGFTSACTDGRCVLEVEN